MAGVRTETTATIEDLCRVEGKAELIDGRIVPLMPTGRRPNRIAFRIAKSLDDHAEAMPFVRKRISNQLANQTMSLGVQLLDLFEALPLEEALRELQHELWAMRSLCLRIFDTKKQVA